MLVNIILSTENAFMTNVYAVSVSEFYLCMHIFNCNFIIHLGRKLPIASFIPMEASGIVLRIVWQPCYFVLSFNM